MSAMTEPVVPAGASARLLRAAVFAAVCVALAATVHTAAACASVPWWTVAAGFAAVLAVAAPLAGRPRSTTTTVVALTAGQLGLHALFAFGQQQASLSAAAAARRSGSGDAAVLRAASHLVCGMNPATMTTSQARRILARAGVHLADTPPVPAAGTHTAAGMSWMPGMGGMPDMAAGDGVLGHLTSLLPSLPMALGHLLAALATGWLLRHGDLALRRTARLSAQGAQEIGGMAETLTDEARLRALRAAFALVRALLAGLPGTRGPVDAAEDAPPGPPLPLAGQVLQHAVIRRGPPVSGFALAS